MWRAIGNNIAIFAMLWDYAVKAFLIDIHIRIDTTEKEDWSKATPGVRSLDLAWFT